ncbi:sodium:solute symporter family protein [Specibacter sp. RAF43]|uniref:sodium:solute symporter family protein n=1 Tax=Specibacter sp. RAF43 TaxID=3233057 RepID=UPI003F96D85B
MDMLIGYGGIALFFGLIVFVLERTKRKEVSFSDYATGGRSFGSIFSTMAFVNTWFPGTIFISFAGLAAGAGVIGFYVLHYSLLAVVVMFFLAKPVHVWGKKFDIRTQADLLGLRYNSKPVRVIAALIGIVATVPWIILGMQSLGLVFRYLSFGSVGAAAAIVIGVIVISARQIWTIKFGMRGIVISDMVQGIFAYILGTFAILGLLVWLVTNGHGFAQVDPAHFHLPGPTSELGGLYFFAIVLTGALGGWCWPDIFVRLFSAKNTKTIKQSAVQAAPLLLIFGSSLLLLSLLASSYPGVKDAPDDVWFIVSGVGGVLMVTFAGICVLAATMGNIGANLQALGTQAANDVIGVGRAKRLDDPKSAKIVVGALTVISALGALALKNVSGGLVVLALVSYQGIVQLAPTLFFGIFWRRGNAVSATASMLTGFATACVLQWFYPVSIPWLGGLTSGVAALVVNALVYVICAFAIRQPLAEQDRVKQLFDHLRESPAADESAHRPLAESSVGSERN